MSLVASKLPQAKYDGLLGFTGLKMIHPCGKLFGLLCGKPKVGKSCFIQSHPEAWVVNFDDTSTTTPDVRATIWPGVGEQGEPIDVDGQPMVLTWEKVKEKIELLKKMSKEGKLVPETIFFDSLGSWIRVLRDFIMRENGKDRWNELDGRRAWDRLYEMVIEECMSLRQHGFGVYIICHVINAKIPIGDDKFVFRPELTITDGFYKRLYPLFELVVAFDIEDRTITETKEQVVEIKGVKKTIKKPSSKRVRQHVMKVDDEHLSEITGQRIQLPATIVLPHVGGWEHFSDVYSKSATSA
jgi:hypothetical protein